MKNFATISELDIARLRKTRNLKIVILECPYDSIQDERTQRLFGKISALKISGYQKEYPYGALPVDTTDFCANHVALCEEVNGQFEPLSAFKSITLDRCQAFHLEFPVFHILDGNSNEPHRMAVKDLIQTAQSKNERVAYNSSWTMKNETREDPKLREFCRDVAIFFLIRYYHDYRIHHCLAGAAVRFRVDQIKEFVGFKRLSLRDEPLPDFQCEPFFGEKVTLMHLNGPTPEALEWSKRFDSYWSERLVISGSSQLIDQLAA